MHLAWNFLEDFYSSGCLMKGRSIRVYVAAHDFGFRVISSAFDEMLRNVSSESPLLHPDRPN